MRALSTGVAAELAVPWYITETSKNDSYEQGNVWHVPRYGGREKGKDTRSCDRRGLPWRFFTLPRAQQLPSC